MLFVPICTFCFGARRQECDDGNTNSTDGCSSTCTVETGYYCTQPLGNQQPSLCTSRCGSAAVWQCLTLDGLARHFVKGIGLEIEVGMDTA